MTAFSQVLVLDSHHCQEDLDGGTGQGPVAAGTSEGFPGPGIVPWQFGSSQDYPTPAAVPSCISVTVLV